MSEDLNHALQALPHGPEFRFIDRLISLKHGQEGVGEYKVRGDEAFLAGHFPNDPMMPGAILIEAVAQLAGVVAQSDPAIGALPGLRLTAIRNAKILGTARPGETVRIEAKVIGRLANLIQAEGRVLLGGKEIALTQITLAGASEKERSGFGR